MFVTFFFISQLIIKIKKIVYKYFPNFYHIYEESATARLKVQEIGGTRNSDPRVMHHPIPA